MKALWFTLRILLCPPIYVVWGISICFSSFDFESIPVLLALEVKVCMGGTNFSKITWLLMCVGS